MAGMYRTVMLLMRGLMSVILLAGVMWILPSSASSAEQSVKIYRIGFLGVASLSGYVRELEAIRAGLRDLGYVEGTNIVVEYRWAEGSPERLKSMAAELVALKVDILITHAIPGARAAMQATTTIPIVAADVTDPVAAGLVANLARPGGNLTGSTSFQMEVQAKRLQLLKEVVPRVRRIAYLVNPLNPGSFVLPRKHLEEAANAMKVNLQEFAVRDSNFPAAFNAMAKARIDADVIGEDPLLNTNAPVIAALAVTHRLPASGFSNFADAGGLLAYGANRPAVYGRTAYFVDRILKGAKPGDIPFERATKFDLIVNVKTAKTLGIKVPPPLLARADKVIE